MTNQLQEHFTVNLSPETLASKPGLTAKSSLSSYNKLPSENDVVNSVHRVRESNEMLNEQVSELQCQLEKCELEISYFKNQNLMLTEAMISKDRIVNETTDKIASHFQLLDKCQKMEDRIKVAKAKYDALQKERNQLYHARRSYINWDGVMTLLAIGWLLASGVYTYTQRLTASEQRKK